MTDEEISIDGIESQTTLSTNDIGQATGVSARTVQHWRGHEDLPHHCRPKRAEVLYELNEIGQLMTMVFPDPNARYAWLRSPSEQLDGMSPFSCVMDGREQAVIEALHAMINK